MSQEWELRCNCLYASVSGAQCILNGKVTLVEEMRSGSLTHRPPCPTKICEINRNSQKVHGTKAGVLTITRPR